VIRKPDSRHNLRSVHSTLQPLAVACMQCQHRAALAHDKIGAYSGNRWGENRREADAKFLSAATVATPFLCECPRYVFYHRWQQCVTT
jgi:hypothetical protein